MKDVSFGQFYPVDSFVHRLDPRLKIVFLIAYIVAIFLASNFYGLAACAAVTCPAAYARLGVAWAVSIAAVREPALGLAFLRESPLDAATHNKAIQKICESRRSTPEYRAAVRALRRPGAALSAK